MRVYEVRRLMLKHNISVNDMIQHGTPVAPSTLINYFKGKGMRAIPDALARCIEEMVNEVRAKEALRAKAVAG